MSLICARCHRGLKDPESIKRGLGPVCASKVDFHVVVNVDAIANFEIVEDTPEKLVIRDIGPWDRFMTVTNAAENVVAQLVGEGKLPDGKRLFYFDSNGDLDEIVVFCGRFAGFKSATALDKRAGAEVRP